MKQAENPQIPAWILMVAVVGGIGGYCLWYKNSKDVWPWEGAKPQVRYLAPTRSVGYSATQPMPGEEVIVSVT